MNEKIAGARRAIDKLLTPVNSVLVKLRVKPDYITLISLLAGLAAVYYLPFRPILAITLLVVFEMMDVMDGSLARATESTSGRGERFARARLYLVGVLLIFRYYVSRDYLFPAVALTGIILFSDHYYLQLLRIKKSLDKALEGSLKRLSDAGVTPNQLTLTGVVVGVLGVAAIVHGRTGTGILLLAAYLVFDTLDGALARVSGKVSRRGARFDVASDALIPLLLVGVYFIASGDIVMSGVFAVILLLLLTKSLKTR